MYRHAKSILLGLSLAAIFFAKVPSAFTADIPKNEQAIREVAEEKRDVARAAWWGYNAEDATAALQAAINSGAKKVIVEKMPGPWIVNKIQLAGDQELFFEPGVVVQAKKNAFHGRGDSLFTVWQKKNVKLIGPGATLRMHRDDYDNPDKYEKAEWRHAISLRGCENVTIQGLTVAESGGDGIYLGVGQKRETCKNIVIRDVVCDKNYRQGISVISADNLLIENCVLKNTAGTAPAAGIDFEPNRATEQLTNCVMRNCQIESNEGCGILMYLGPLTGKSKPVSVRFENCVTRGINRRRSVSVIASCKKDGPVKGSIDFVNCRFEDEGKAGLNIQSISPNGLQLRFVDCTIADTMDSPALKTPIVFTTSGGDLETTGGVEFDNLTICEKTKRPLMAYSNRAGKNLGEITGKITIKRDEKPTVYQLTPEVIQQWIPFNPMLEIPSVGLENLDLKPIAKTQTPPVLKYPPHQLRGHGCYLVYASTGDTVRLRLKHQAVGKNDSEPMAVQILDPSGEELRSLTIKLNQEANVSFKAKKTGLFTIQCAPKRNLVQLLTSSHPACIAGINKDRFHLFRTTGNFFFVVPRDTQEFGLQFQGGGTSERISAVVYDTKDNLRWEKKNINNQAESFVIKRKPSKQDEVWAIQLVRPDTDSLEDWSLTLRGIPAILGFGPQYLLHTTD